MPGYRAGTRRTDLENDNGKSSRDVSACEYEYETNAVLKFLPLSLALDEASTDDIDLNSCKNTRRGMMSIVRIQHSRILKEIEESCEHQTGAQHWQPKTQQRRHEGMKKRCYHVEEVDDGEVGRAKLHHGNLQELGSVPA